MALIFVWSAFLFIITSFILGVKQGYLKKTNLVVWFAIILQLTTAITYTYAWWFKIAAS